MLDASPSAPHGTCEKGGCRPSPAPACGMSPSRKSFVYVSPTTGCEPGPWGSCSAARPRAFEPVSVAARTDEAWKGWGLERVTPHECRHSYSSFFDAAGVWPTRADRYMGHADRSTPGRYRHQLDGQLVEDAALLDAYLSLTGAHTGAHSPDAVSLSES